MKFTLYDGISKPRTIEVENIVKARAYVVRWVGGSMSEIGGVLIVKGISGARLGQVRGSADGKMRWTPYTKGKTGNLTMKWSYRLNKDGTLGKRLGDL